MEKDDEKTKRKLELADEAMHKIGYLAGRLDVTGGTVESLVKLCQEVRDELAFAAERYWKS